jgi:hypothetical protein
MRIGSFSRLNLSYLCHSHLLLDSGGIPGESLQFRMVQAYILIFVLFSCLPVLYLSL